MNGGTKHLFENGIYLISNGSVASNLLFYDCADREYFLEKMQKYLHPIADILEFHLLENQFSLLVKIKDRLRLMAFFRKKHNDQKTEDFYIPASTYIFSQEMANLQVSYVKYFNHKYKRKGTLFIRRFARLLIESEMQLKTVRNGIYMYKEFIRQGKDWRDKKLHKRIIRDYLKSSEALRIDLKNGRKVELRFEKLLSNSDYLRGNFEFKQSQNLNSPFIQKILLYYRKKVPFGPNLN